MKKTSDIYKFKLGKLSKHRDPRTLSLKSILNTNELPPIPEIFSPVPDINKIKFQMFGNDEIGDCTCAKMGNCEILWGVIKHGESYIQPTEDQVIKAYSKITGYVPGAEIIKSVKELSSGFVPDSIGFIENKQLEDKEKPYAFQKPQVLHDEEIEVEENADLKKKLTDLFVNNRDKILKNILRITKDETLADDMCQEVFIKIISNPLSYKQDYNFLGWVSTVSRNACMDYFRMKKRKSFFELNENSENIEDEDVLDYETTRQEKEKMLAEYIDKLPNEQKEVVLMRLKGLSFQEIAKITGDSINTCLGRNRYAMKKFETLKSN